jgi:hypothetical protein
MFFCLTATMRATLARVKDSPFAVALVLLLALLSTFLLLRGFGSAWFFAASARLGGLLPPLSAYNCVESTSITSTLDNTNVTIDYHAWEEFSALVERRRTTFVSGLHSSTKYRVAMCTITRNELHLKEWIVRNTLMGIEHFFLYDTNQVCCFFSWRRFVCFGRE